MGIRADGEWRSAAWLAANASSVTQLWARGDDLELPLALPVATEVNIMKSSNLTTLPAMPASLDVFLLSLPALVELPEFPAATRVVIEGCPGLALSVAPPPRDIWFSADQQTNTFVGVRI